MASIQGGVNAIAGAVTSGKAVKKLLGKGNPFEGEQFESAIEAMNPGESSKDIRAYGRDLFADKVEAGQFFEQIGEVYRDYDEQAKTIANLNAQLNAQGKGTQKAQFQERLRMKRKTVRRGGKK